MDSSPDLWGLRNRFGAHEIEWSNGCVWPLEQRGAVFEFEAGAECSINYGPGLDIRWRATGGRVVYDESTLFAEWEAEGEMAQSGIRVAQTVEFDGERTASP